MNEVFTDGATVVHDDRAFIDIHRAIRHILAGQTINVSEPAYIDDDGYPVADDGYNLTLSDLPAEHRNTNYLYEKLRGYDLSVV